MGAHQTFGRKLNIDEHIDQFLAEFVRADARRRYKSIFSLNESRWDKITFHDFASVQIDSPMHTFVRGIRPNLPHPSHSPQVGIWDDPVLDLIRPYADSCVDVFSTGHTKNTGHKRSFLYNAVTDYSIILDGFVTIVPNRLYALFDHDDNITICRNQT